MPELPGILGSRRSNTTPSPDVSEPLDLLIKGEASKKSQTQVSLDAMEEPPVVAPEEVIGTLSKDVFERGTSTGSEAVSLFICLDANKLVLLSFFSLLKTIYPRVSTKPLPNDAKRPLPVDVRRSTTLLLKLPTLFERWCGFFYVPHEPYQ